MLLILDEWHTEEECVEKEEDEEVGAEVITVTLRKREREAQKLVFAIQIASLVWVFALGFGLLGLVYLACLTLALNIKRAPIHCSN